MIIKCPQCSTGFAIKEELLPQEGRKVKCSKCSHVWLQRRPWVKPEVDTMPDFKFRTPLKPKVSQPPARSWTAILWVLLFCLFGTTLSGFYGFRTQIVTFFPNTLKLYKALSIPVTVVPPLQFSQVVVEKGRRDGDVLISGQILNTTKAIRPVPPILLLPITGKSKGPIFYASKDKLNPGEHCEFHATVPSELIDESGMKLKFSVQDED